MNVRHFRHTASSYLIIGSSSIFSHLVSAITTITKLLAVCSLKLCTCELFSSKFEIFRSDIIIHPTTHTHTHLNNLSKLLPFSHFQLGIYWKTNCVCATPNTFFFFNYVDIYMIFPWFFVYPLRALTKWSYVRYTIDQSRDAFPHFFGKMNLNSISTFHFYWMCVFVNLFIL